MSHLPRVSVIVPSLNHGDDLERALCSVLDQDYPDLELIVIDGNSNDQTRQVLDHYRPQLAHCHVGPDGGPADAINHGLSLATGRVVTCMSTDHLMLPGTLHQIADQMTRGNRPAWVIGQHLTFGAEGRDASCPPPHAPEHLRDLLLSDDAHLPLTGAFFQSGLLKRHRFFNAAMRYAYGHEMACRLTAAGEKPQILMQTLVTSHRRSASRSIAHALDHWLEHIETAELHGPSLETGDQQALQASCDRQRQLLQQARASLGKRDHDAARWTALLRHPRRLAAPAQQKSLLDGSVSLPTEQAWRQAA